VVTQNTKASADFAAPDTGGPGVRQRTPLGAKKKRKGRKRAEESGHLKGGGMDRSHHQEGHNALLQNYKSHIPETDGD